MAPHDALRSEPETGQAEELAAFRTINADANTPILITCDHASRRVPAMLRSLGLPERELARHIGWDIGAAEIATRLATWLGATAVLSGVSRLVIDCNRFPSDPSCIAEVSDGTPVPANIGLTDDQKRTRFEAWHRPYHRAIAELLERRVAAGIEPVVVSIHTMTDRMRGAFRPWQIALSSSSDRRLTDPVLSALRTRTDLTIGDNEPYSLCPDEDYSTTTHALARGLHHVQVEFRQDLVGTAEGARVYADIFSKALIKGLEAIGRNGSVRHA